MDVARWVRFGGGGVILAGFVYGGGVLIMRFVDPPLFIPAILVYVGFVLFLFGAVMDGADDSTGDEDDGDVSVDTEWNEEN
jgi:hypothetical protein